MKGIKIGNKIGLKASRVKGDGVKGSMGTEGENRVQRGLKERWERETKWKHREGYEP